MNRRSALLVSAPASEPVALSDVKLFLRIDGTDDDTLLTSLIATARRACEDYCQRAFITQTWKLTLDRFNDRDPEAGLSAGFSVGPTPALVDGSRAIKLPRPAIQSITSIKTTDVANVQTTVDAAVYALDAAGGRVLLNDGKAWPINLRAESAVEITTTNGYGAAAAVPEPIKQAIIQYVGAMYTSRQCGALPDGCKEMLAPYRTSEAFVTW